MANITITPTFVEEQGGNRSLEPESSNDSMVGILQKLAQDVQLSVEERELACLKASNTPPSIEGNCQDFEGIKAKILKGEPLSGTELMKAIAFNSKLANLMAIGCVSTKKGYSVRTIGEFDSIGGMWPYVNNTFCDKETNGFIGHELWLFKVLQGHFETASQTEEEEVNEITTTGPLIENWMNLIENGRKISGMTSLIFNFKPVDEPFTNEQIMQINRDTALFFIGADFKHYKNVLGVRFKYTKVEGEEVKYLPQIRVWLNVSLGKAESLIGGDSGFKATYLDVMEKGLPFDFQIETEIRELKEKKTRRRNRGKARGYRAHVKH